MTSPCTMIPGLLDNGIEFFKSSLGLKVIKNGQVKDFSEVSAYTIELLNEKIKSEPEVERILVEMHPSSGLERLKQFVECRFGGLDGSADLIEGKFQDGEYHPCPKRGSCPHEGVLCKLPFINGSRLESIEVDIIKMSVTDTKNEVIAENLELPLGTFHQIKKNLYQKMAVNTKQELTLRAFFYNLIWQ